MNVKELTAVLNTVEQDHQLVLQKVQSLKETVNLLEPDEKKPREALQRLRNLHDYFTTQFAIHLDEEEITLFPLLERRSGSSELLSRLRAEHEDLRRKCERFGNDLEIAAQLEDHVPKAVVRDVLTDAWDLWELLDRHAHAETHAVQECLLGAISVP